MRHRWTWFAPACLRLLLLAGSFASSARAQDPIGGALADALRGLDTDRLRTGVLYDRVLPLSGIERFDGGDRSATANLATWRQLLDEIRRASLAGAPPSSETILTESRDAIHGGFVPLALLNYRYDRIRPDALERGALVVKAGRLAAGDGDPFVTGRAVALAAVKERTGRGGDVAFSLAAAHYFSNDAAPPRRVEIDFDDNRGFRPVSFDGRCSVHYDRPGSRTIRVRLTLADGSVQHASCAFTVVALQTPSPDDTLHITASAPYQSQFGTGDAYVYRAPGHPSLVNPVIVVEGFDLDNTMGWDELYALLDQQGLIETLRSDGYDAVVLDFTEATDYVQKNAFVLTELIQQVEATIAPQATVALVGASMGGLVSRFALAYLESQGIPHRVRTFISFDAPQAGADIPLGIQYWVKFFSGQSTDAAHLLERLQTPAARQMLVYHLTDPPGSTGESDPLRAILLSDLVALGNYPSLPRLVAVANGSGSRANQGFAAGDQLIQYVYGTLFVDIVGNVWAVPDQTSHIVFDGRIRILFSDTRQSVTVTATQPYDSAPGGSRATMTQMDTTQAPYGDIVALHPSHCFIPTTSALAIDTADPFYDVAGDPNLLAHTPFDAVYYPIANQEHVSITPESAVWFRTEIESGVTAVPPGVSETGRGIALAVAAPNPFQGSTRIAFTLPGAAQVDLRIYAVDGREVARLADGGWAAGTHQVVWAGGDRRGRPAPAGLYLIRLQAGGQVLARRVVKIE